MNKLDIAKDIIKEFYFLADCGIYDTRNIVGDRMTTIYEDDELTIDICYDYSYFEVFGLSKTDFNELEKFYNTLDEEEV
jgi:hypothetical protein